MNDGVTGHDDGMSDTLDVGDIEVTNNSDEQRYEVRVNGELAGLTTYRLADDRVVFSHAEVAPEWEGRGVGSALAQAALDDVIAAGKLITPQCPFIADYISRHPSYLPHVDERHRDRIEAAIAVAPADDD
jgi:predicted GNAT family acetyltransferase